MRKVGWLFILLALAIVPAQAQIQQISGYDPRYIEIDGNITTGGPCLGSPCTDWLVKQQDGTIVGLVDPIGNNDTSILSPDSIYSSGSTLPKQDITRVWLSNNKEYLFLAEERRANNGSSGWHIFVTKTVPTVVVGQPVVFHLNNGDLEIRICFPKGGAPEDASIAVLQVQGLASTLNVVAGDLWTSGAFQSTSFPVPFAMNLSPTQALAGAVDSKGNPTTTYDTVCFAESAISLADVGIAPCGTTAYITVITRSSCTLTSDLKDIGGPVAYNFGGPELTVAAPVTDCTQSVTLSATASKGIKPYTFKWFDNGSLTPFRTQTVDAEPATDSFSITLSPGPHDVTVEVTDSADCSATGSVDRFTLYVPLTLALTKPIVPDCANTVTLSATADKGLAPYQFKWYDNDVLIRSMTKAGPGPATDSFSYTFTTVGDHTIRVDVTDARTCAQTDSQSNITVYGLLSLALTKPITPDCTNTATLSATVDKGLAPYEFKWYDNDVLIRDTTNAGPAPATDSFSYTFTTVGDHTIRVDVTDARNCAQSDSAPDITVYGLLGVSIAPSVPTCNESVTWTATPSGGKGPLVYEWKLDGVVVNGTGATYSYASNPDCNDHTVSVKITDARGCTNTDAKTIHQNTVTTFP